MEPPFNPFLVDPSLLDAPNAINKNNTCGVYGDLRPYKPGATVSVMVDGMARTLKVCDYHQAFFEDWQPDLYELGLSFTGEVEIRPIPARPIGPTPQADKGTSLFLKIAVVDQDLAPLTNGSTNGFLLDTARQGSSPVPPWATKVGEDWKIQRGVYLTRLAAKGVVTFDEIPDQVYIEAYTSIQAGAYIDWNSAGVDSQGYPVPAWNPSLVNALQFADAVSQITAANTEVTLNGIVVDNLADTRFNPKISLNLRYCITRLEACRAYQEAELN